MPADTTEPLFDVIEVEIATGRTLRILDTGTTERNADAIVSMAVMRRGVETSIFLRVPASHIEEVPHAQ